ncbi:MAG: hypothetical protein ACRC10_06640 [Thermoguttaceae bacterium]
MMQRLFSRRVLIILAIIIAIAFVGMKLFRTKTQAHFPDTVVPIPLEQGQSLEADTKTEQYVIAELIGCGWTKNAAEGVYQLNTRLYDGIAERLGYEELDKNLAKLRRLGKPEYQNGLEAHPELATLLGSVLDVDSAGAANILRTLPSNEHDMILLLSLYQTHAAPEDASLLARILQNPEYRQYMLKLLNQSPENVELYAYLVMLDQLTNRSESAAVVFQQWLLTMFDKLLVVDIDSQQGQRLRLQLTIHSRTLAQRLVSDPEFCEDFLRCWREFAEILANLNPKGDESKLSDRSDFYEQVWLNYNQNPEVLRFLHLYRDEHAVPLLKEYGTSVCDILLSGPYLKPENQSARKKLVSLMLSANQNLRQSIVFANLPQYTAFITLLSRPLNQHTFYGMIEELARANTAPSSKSPGQLIGYWNSLGDAALEKEFVETNPGLWGYMPGYDVYNLGVKYLDGREISGMDMVYAGVDAAFVVVDVATLGAGVAMTKTLSTATKTAGKSGTEIILKDVTQTAGKNLTREVVKETPWQSLGVLKNASRYFSGQFTRLPHVGYIDATNFTRYMYEKTGIGAKTFKKFTDLDARCFMRQDRRVVIDLQKIPQTRVGQLTRNYMADTALGCGFGAVLMTEPGQSAARKTIETGMYVGGQIMQTAEEVNKNWKQNLSLWWMTCQKD